MDNTDVKSEKKFKSQLFLYFAIIVVIIVVIGIILLKEDNDDKEQLKEFEIVVKSQDGLEISLDGRNYSSGIILNNNKITKEIENTYPKNSNHWLGDNLTFMPISTEGKLNYDTGTLIFYSIKERKDVPGGYRLVSELLNNVRNVGLGEESEYVVNEKDGYIVFDLFVKNGSEKETNETEITSTSSDKIYLTKDTKVTVDSENKGVENALRIAFIEIGNTLVTSDKDVVQSINCNQNENNEYKSLCDKNEQGVTWNIYESNNAHHYKNSCVQFNRKCKNRIGINTYSENCQPLEETSIVDTFVVNQEISYDNNVNIYDGLNDYQSNQLTRFNYYNDDMRSNSDPDKIESILSLDNNTITKVRVYIYLEGQDIDNLDYGSVDDSLHISFGFTKDVISSNTYVKTKNE